MQNVYVFKISTWMGWVGLFFNVLVNKMMYIFKL